MTNNIQGNSHQAISWFLNRNSTSQKRMAWYIYSDDREEPTTKNTLPSKTLLQIWWRNQKLSRQAKIKRIQHHQTSFTTNAKGTSLGRKHKWRKRPTEDEPETIKIQVIGSCCVLCSVTQSCPTLCDSTDCSPPGFSVHGVLQARILEWVAMPSSRGSSPLRNRTRISYMSCTGRRILYH